MLKYLGAASLLVLAACATTSPDSSPSADTMAANETMASDTTLPSGTMGMASGAQISAAPVPVTLKKDFGQNKVFQTGSQIAIGGYNVAGFVESEATGRASDMFGGSGGARVTVNMTTEGIDKALLTRIADAAEADLIAQLQAAGYGVVPASSVMAAGNAGTLELGTIDKTRKLTTPRGKRVLLTSGPSDFGTRTIYTNGRMVMGYPNAPARLAGELDAIVVMPELVIDFADMSANRSIGKQANVDYKLNFAIDGALSVVTFMGTNNGSTPISYRAMPKDNVVVDGRFASMTEVETKENMLEQGLGLALGMRTMAKKGSDKVVRIDPQAYEQLAMKAAKGYNAAIVAELKARRG